MVDKKKVDNLAKDIKLFEKDTDNSLVSLLMRSGMTKEEAIKYHKQSKKTVKAKGGMVKGYMGGGEVHMDDSPNSGMITTKGWGKSRAT